MRSYRIYRLPESQNNVLKRAVVLSVQQLFYYRRAGERKRSAKDDRRHVGGQMADKSTAHQIIHDEPSGYARLHVGGYLANVWYRYSVLIRNSRLNKCNKTP